LSTDRSSPKFTCPARLAAFAATALTLPALAGPPLITDDPDPVEKGHWEINLPYTLDVSAKDASGKRSFTHQAPLFDINYGITDYAHLKLEGPFEIVDNPGEGPRAGPGDTSLGSKIRFINQEKGAPLSLSIFPAIGIPTGDSGRGLGEGSPVLVLPVEIGRKFFGDKLFVYADVGYEAHFANDEADIWRGGIACEAQVVDGLTFCAEVRFEYRDQGTPDDALWQLGFKYALSEHVGLMAAAGRSFNPDIDAGSDLLVYIGVQLSF
jgi:hypothetical protein